jgi:hypothetical protein
VTRKRDPDARPELVSTGAAPLAREEAEPPVVARLIVEIRSDGSRTIARGAMEDVAAGEKVSVEARGDSPLSLAMALARSIFSLPGLARSTARALIPTKRRR